MAGRSSSPKVSTLPGRATWRRRSFPAPRAVRSRIGNVLRALLLDRWQCALRGDGRGAPVFALASAGSQAGIRRSLSTRAVVVRVLPKEGVVTQRFGAGNNPSTWARRRGSRPERASISFSQACAPGLPSRRQTKLGPMSPRESWSGEVDAAFSRGFAPIANAILYAAPPGAIMRIGLWRPFLHQDEDSTIGRGTPIRSQPPDAVRSPSAKSRNQGRGVVVVNPTR